MAKKRRKPGPKTSKGRDPLHSVRVPDKKWRKWQRYAAKEGISVSQLIRDAVDQVLA